MNDLCTSLGDCGASINYIGKVSDSGYTVTSDQGEPARLTNDDIFNMRNLDLND